MEKKCLTLGIKWCDVLLSKKNSHYKLVWLTKIVYIELSNKLWELS